MIASLLQDTPDAVTLLGQQVNLLWIVIGAVLVIFMQAGFALVETGFCRAKHAAHVVSTNFAIFGLGFVGFFLVGYAFMFGGYSYVLPGFDFGYNAPIGDDAHRIGQLGVPVAGRLRRSSDMRCRRWRRRRRVLPLHGRLHGHHGHDSRPGPWPSGGSGRTSCCGASSAAPSTTRSSAHGRGAAAGWPSSATAPSLGFGYVDFAGSGVVHTMGGAAALAGAIVLGPRIGKFGKDGKANALPGHHIPMAMLGTFILLFGWFGFNAASTLAATDVQFAVVATNTAIAGAFGAVACMLYVMWTTGKPDPAMMANGMLAGLVAITARAPSSTRGRPRSSASSPACWSSSPSASSKTR